MKRGKVLILLCVLLVVSIGGYIAAKQYAKNRPEEDPQDGQEVESDPTPEGYGHLYEFDADDVETIRIVNALDDFTLRNIMGTDESGSKNDDFDWVIEGHESWTLEHTEVTNTVEIADSVFANRMADEDAVANERNLEDFGLKDPASQITVTFKDGSTQTIYVGNRTVDGKFYYGMIEGDDAIYTLGRNAGNTAEFTARSLRFISSLDIEKESSELYYLLIENENGRNTEITYAGIDDKGETLEYYNADTFKLSYGEHFAYDKQFFVSGNLTDIFASMPDTILPTDQIEDEAEDLDKYGLGETPKHHVRLTYRVEVQESEISQAIESGVEVDLDLFVKDEETGLTYVYITNDYTFGNEYTGEDGTPMVYFRFSESSDVFGVAKADVDKFNFDPYIYVQRVLYMNNIKNVASMKLTIGDEVHDIEFKRGEVTVDEDGNEQQDVVYKIDGQLIKEDLFKTFYTSVIGIMSDYEIYGEDPEYDEKDVLTIDYVFNDGSTHSITYYRTSDFYYVTEVGEHTWFACSYTQFAYILENMQKCFEEAA